LEAKLAEDEELARQLSAELEREESSQLEADSRYAQEIQSNIDRVFDHKEDHKDDDKEDDEADAKEDSFPGRGGQTRHPSAREQSDEILTKKLLTQSAREAYEHALSQKILSSHDTTHLSAIASQWNDCAVEISNVHSGLCLSLLLPHLKSLKIKFHSKSKGMLSGKRGPMVSIEASRMILPDDKTATRENSFYSAEFELQGVGVELSEEDMSYRYSSETGLLHIYLEQVEIVPSSSASSSGAERGEEKDSSSRGRGRQEREGYWFTKESFMRIFNKR
jgi:hypothetical protein